MKLLKLLKAFFFFPAVVLILGSCTDDDKSLDGLWRSIATVDNSAVSLSSFTLDDGRTLRLSSPLSIQPQYKRVIIDYMLLDENGNTVIEDDETITQRYIKLYDIYDVLTKDIVYIPADDSQLQDSIGYNPVKVEQIWEGGGFLNFYFAVNTSGNGTSHFINLLSEEPVGTGANEDVVKLQFRHNDMGDTGGYKAYSYASFELEPYRKEDGGTVNFEISWTDLGSGATKTYTIEYNYAAQKASVATRIPAISASSAGIIH